MRGVAFARPLPVLPFLGQAAPLHIAIALKSYLLTDERPGEYDGFCAGGQ